MTTPTVKQDPTNEIPAEILATDIQKIAVAVDVLFRSRLKDSTVVMLIARASGVSMTNTAKVLYAARDLAKEYLKPSQPSQSATTTVQRRKR